MSIIDTKYFSLQKLSEGIYAAIANPGEGAWSNSGFIDLGDELLVFDSFSTPSAASELMRQAKAITGKKVKYLINSHYHGDHVFGNQVFSDIIIISTSLTRRLSEEQNRMKEMEVEQEEMRQYLQFLKEQAEVTIEEVLRQSILNQYAEMSKILEAVPSLKTVFPNVTFENKLVIHGSKRCVELHNCGGGHTEGDCLLYIPEEKIAFMGDVITEELHLPIFNPEEFIGILNRINKMDIDLVVPGHGNIGNLKLCETLIGYLVFLKEKAREAHENKASLEDFISGFSTPDEYKRWKGQNGIKRNLDTVYKYYKDNI